ncbi:MAG: hypothetical protein Q8Q65_00670 [bacterium]|nr:hypothetical protein [bacterium]
MKIQVVNGKLAEILQKDLALAEYAVKQLKEEVVPFEKKYSMKWNIFIKKFEGGKLGDDRKWFKWYALSQFILDWNDTKSEIKTALPSS